MISQTWHRSLFIAVRAVLETIAGHSPLTRVMMERWKRAVSHWKVPVGNRETSWRSAYCIDLSRITNSVPSLGSLLRFNWSGIQTSRRFQEWRRTISVFWIPISTARSLFRKCKAVHPLRLNVGRWLGNWWKGWDRRLSVN